MNITERKKGEKEEREKEEREKEEREDSPIPRSWSRKGIGIGVR